MLVRLYTKQMDAHIFKNIDELVREDRVHRRVYTDPAIFDLEMKRIFGSAWLYVGHQSQVPKVGDFVTCELAAQPVVMLRHHDGEIHVLFNRCAHRGARICEADDGNVKLLQCPYHGWTYDTAGRFLNSALHRDYAAAPERDTGRLDLRAVARVTSYRGFVFASLAATGPTLEESFGPMLSAIDNLVDRSPDGELELLPGVHRHFYRGNWKMQIENLQDAAHPAFVHESSNVAGVQRDKADRDARAEDFMVANASAPEFMDEGGLTVFPGGHSYTAGLPIGSLISDDTQSAYVAALKRGHGEAKAMATLNVSRHYNVLYPQLMIQAEFQTIKILHPRAVDRTELAVYCFRLKGAPEEFERVAVRYFDATNSAASPILTDDLIVYENAQHALTTQGSDWVLFANGLTSEMPGENGERSGRGLSELPMRNQFVAWRTYMHQDRISTDTK